jgi:hypothetical protein
MKHINMVVGAILFGLAYLLDARLAHVHGPVVLAALSGFTGLASYDVNPSQTGHLDLSDEISSILLADHFLLGMIGSKGQATQVDHYWLEDALNAHYVTLNGAIDNAATSISVVGIGGVQIGALLVDEALGSQEVIQVTAVSGTTLTVVRGAGDAGPAAEAHLDQARLRIMARPKPEGDENVSDESTQRSRKHNVCQIFKSEVYISGTQSAVALAGVPNELAHQTAQRLMELTRQLSMTAWGGVKITSAGAGGSDSVYRSMDGLRNFVRAQASQLDTTAQALTEATVNKLYRKIWDLGGQANFAIGHAEQMTAFSEMYKDKIRLAPTDASRGVYVTKFLTDLGVEIDLKVDRWVGKGDLLLGDSSRINLAWLKGRNMQQTPLDKRGDSLRAMMVGEATLEVRNAGQCFALASGLTARS